MQTSRYIVKRILLALVSLFAIITITYFLMNLMPGDPFMSEKASEENRAILIAKYGLDQPVYVQYGKYLENPSCTGIWEPAMCSRKAVR